MEEILKIAKLKTRINELTRKHALNRNRFDSYAERMEKEIDELEHELRKSNQEKEFMRYTMKRRDDEHDEFISNAYAQTFTQNIQLRDWLNKTTSNLQVITSELRATNKQFEDYRKQAVESESIMIEEQQKIALENEQLRRQLAESLRPKDEKAGPIQEERHFKSSKESLDNDVMIEKESSHQKKKKTSKKSKKKRKRENKKDKSAPITTAMKSVRTNTSDSGLDEKMAPLDPGIQFIIQIRISLDIFT